MSDTPLHAACGYDRNKPLEHRIVKPSLEKARQVVESEGTKYLEVKDYDGWTPIHTAARYDKSGEIVESLIQHDAKIQARDNAGRTPLFSASYSNNSSAALVLLRHGANIKAQDDEGWTAFHLAFSWGRKEVAEMILNFVVDSAIVSSTSLSLGLGKGLEEARNLVMNIRNNKGKAALDLAESQSRTEIIQWWETFQRETEDLQQQERFFMLERTDPAMDALWSHALHKAGKKSVSHLWYFVQRKGPSLIVESNNARSLEQG